MFKELVRSIISLFSIEDPYHRFSMKVYHVKNSRLLTITLNVRFHLKHKTFEMMTKNGKWVTFDTVFTGNALNRVIRKATYHAEKEINSISS
jgi:hypothetical protein